MRHQVATRGISEGRKYFYCGDCGQVNKNTLYCISKPECPKCNRTMELMIK